MSETVMAPVTVNWLTSGAISIVILFSLKTVGVKAKPTPNCLNSMVKAPVNDPVWGTGIGNSPPARKLAISPEMVVKLGSAKIDKYPSSSSASIMRTSFSPVSTSTTLRSTAI